MRSKPRVAWAGKLFKMPSDLPRFLECEEPATGRLFVLHTRAPRILAELHDDNSLVWVRGWGDPIPPDFNAARLMREMGDWYAEILNEE